MTVEIKFPNYDSRNQAYVTWRPVAVQLKLAQPGPANVPVTVTAKTTATGGRLVFATMLTHLGAANLQVTLPANGSPVSVWVGGQSPHPNGQSPTASTTFGDVSVEVRSTATNQVLATHKTMVRARKNVEKMTGAERSRFLSALAALNGSGRGLYTQFRDMHVDGMPDDEAHRGPGFLPWHRAYLLDFERELQAIDPEVTLPYWRFDQAAPNVFSGAFMGVPNNADRVQFAAGNPMGQWVAVGSTAGVERGRGVGPQTVPNVRTERETIIAPGPAGLPYPNFARFRDMQGNPHGYAHTSHNRGWIFYPGSAPRDPLFFLLHCNVDRLWAKWQWAAKIHNPTDPKSFDAVANARPGHRLNDFLWPWCGPNQPGRPPSAPGGGLAPSPMTAAPGARPRVSQMIDYLGTVSADHLGFAYDDVPFQK